VGGKRTEKGKIVIPVHKPDLGELLFFFTCGAVISVPLSLFIYRYTNLVLAGLEPLRITLISSIIFAPLIEEFAKAFPLFYRHGETEKSIFTLGFFVGLGFGISAPFHNNPRILDPLIPLARFRHHSVRITRNSGNIADTGH